MFKGATGRPAPITSLPRRAQTRGWPATGSGWLARVRPSGAAHRGVLVAVTLMLMLGGSLAAVLGARSVASSEAEKARLAFHATSEEVASTLKLAIQHEEDLVEAASAYVTSNPHATPAQFDLWATSVQALRRYPELQNIGLVKLVRAAEVPSFERYIAAHPVRPLGPNSVAPMEGFEIEPGDREAPPPTSRPARTTVRSRRSSPPDAKRGRRATRRSSTARRRRSGYRRPCIAAARCRRPSPRAGASSSVGWASC